MKKNFRHIGFSSIVSLIGLALLVAPVVSAHAAPNVCPIQKMTCCCCVPAEDKAEASADKTEDIQATCPCNMEQDNSADRPISETQITYDNRENKTQVIKEPVENDLVIFTEKTYPIKPIRADYSSPPLFILNTSFLI